MYKIMKFSDLTASGLPLIRVDCPDFGENLIIHNGSLNEFINAAKDLNVDGIFYWGFSAKELFNGVQVTNSGPTDLSDIEINSWLSEVGKWVTDDIGKEHIAEIIKIDSPLSSLEIITRFQVFVLYQGKYIISNIFEPSWVQTFHDNFSQIQEAI